MVAPNVGKSKGSAEITRGPHYHMTVSAVIAMERFHWAAASVRRRCVRGSYVDVTEGFGLEVVPWFTR